MNIRPKPHATGRVKPGDTSQRVGVEQLEARGIDVPAPAEKLNDAAGAEGTRFEMRIRGVPDASDPSRMLAAVRGGLRPRRASAGKRAGA